MPSVGRLRWKMLALMLAGTVVIYVDRNVLGVLAPILKKDLNFSTEQYSYVVSAFQIVYSFSQPVAGFLTDLIGPRIGYAVAALVWGTAAALHGLSTGWISMASFRALLGLSEAVAIPTGTKMSTEWFPSSERSIATGWFNSGSSIGSMITPPLVIWLAVGWGWRPAFLITGCPRRYLRFRLVLALSRPRVASRPLGDGTRLHPRRAASPRRQSRRCGKSSLSRSSSASSSRVS